MSFLTLIKVTMIVPVYFFFIIVTSTNAINSTDNEYDEEAWFVDLVRWADRSKISRDNYKILLILY